MRNKFILGLAFSWCFPSGDALFAQGGCEPPTASFTSNGGDTVRICAGATVTFDGSSSAAALGGTIAQWIWNDGETEVITDVPVVTWTFLEGGYYPMTLNVMDDIACMSSVPATLPVLVSSTPDFSDHVVPVSACAGVPIPFSIDPVAPPMVAAAGIEWGGDAPYYLPDDVGHVNVLPIEWITSDPSAVIASAEQLGDICLDIEHSSAADLIIELICPNGQSVVLANNGADPVTFLGLAVDSNAPDSITVPGICATYCFNADPDFGTWDDHGYNGPSPNMLGPGSHTLLPGSYTPLEPLSQLIGCPVNGTWTLEITDYWAADNGYLCGWNMGLQEDAGFMAYGPVLGTGSADSSSWSGPNVVNDPGAPTTATSAGNAPGPHLFTYAVTDSYGCAYDTTFTVLVLDPFTVDAGADTSVCATAAPLDGRLFVNGDPHSCTYTLIMRDSGFNGWGAGYVRIYRDGVFTQYTMPLLTNEHQIEVNLLGTNTISLFYVGSTGNAQNSLLLLNAQGDTLAIALNGPLNGMLYSGTVPCSILGTSLYWTPADGLSDPGSLTPTALPAVPTNYVLHMAIAGAAGCEATDTVFVDAAHAEELVLTYEPPMLCVMDTTFEQYTWSNSSGNVFQTTTPCITANSPAEGRAWSVVATDSLGCIAQSDTLVYCPPIVFTTFTDYVTTAGNYDSYVWSYNGVGIHDGYLNFAYLVDPGYYSVTVTTDFGCELTATYAYLTMDVRTAQNTNLVVAPNPNDGSFRVLVPGALSASILRLVDMSGRLVHQQRIPQHAVEITVLVECDVVPGTYVMELSGDGRATRQRVVVAR